MDMDTPNLDAILDPEEMDVFAETFHFLEAYCLLKRDAMYARLNGKIERALELECECEKIYKDLPEGVRW